MTVQETNLAAMIETAADRAKYDECAKKILTFDVIIAWILKCCTEEFAQYSVKYIMENCLGEKPEISKRAVHQDQLDKDERNKQLDGDSRMEGLNTEATAIKEQTVYFDIRFKAYLPDREDAIQLIINLEIQLNDVPGYPLVKRGLYYCSRMISEQYGTVFTKEHYENICKVYSIWICPDPAQKRKNGIFEYGIFENEVYGSSSAEKKDYDLMKVVILNLGNVEEESDVEIIHLLNILFSSTISPEEKKKKLNDNFNIAMTREFESEVERMCNLSDGLVEVSVKKGISQGMVAAVQMCKQFGKTLPETTQAIADAYHLSLSEAEAIVKENW